MNEMLQKIEKFLKKIWWVVLIPIGLFIIGALKGKSSFEIKKEIEEAKKKVKQDEEDVKKAKEEVEKTEDKIKKESSDIEETIKEDIKKKEEQDESISEFLPGLKK